MIVIAKIIKLLVYKQSYSRKRKVFNSEYEHVYATFTTGKRTVWDVFNFRLVYYQIVTESKHREHPCKRDSLMIV